MLETAISATYLARNLSDVLNRVQYRGERFLVQKNGHVVAVIEPPLGVKPARTVGEFVARVGHLRMPEGMGHDIEEALKHIGPMPEPPTWES